MYSASRQQVEESLGVVCEEPQLGAVQPLVTTRRMGEIRIDSGNHECIALGGQAEQARRIQQEANDITFYDRLDELWAVAEDHVLCGQIGVSFQAHLGQGAAEHVFGQLIEKLAEGAAQRDPGRYDHPGKVEPLGPHYHGASGAVGRSGIEHIQVAPIPAIPKNPPDRDLF